MAKKVGMLVLSINLHVFHFQDRPVILLTSFLIVFYIFLAELVLQKVMILCPVIREAT